VRPRRLRVKGYTAFVEEAEIDFDGLDLFAITGPTGAGKTSLLQAMTIALYGRAPRLGDDLRQLISPLAGSAWFHLEFRARGRDYQIVRVMSRTRPTTVALEARGDDGAWQTLTRGVREANARVEQILGLDFDSFTKVVLLPQNEFDAFLRGKPEERRSILTRLLSLEIYGRIQQRANQVAVEARTQADVLTGLLEGDYADATPERLESVRERRAEAESAAQAVTRRLAALERASTAAGELHRRRGEHRIASERVAAHERALADAGEERAAGERALTDAEREVQTCVERLAAIRYDADRHLQLVGAQAQAARLGDLVAALRQLDDADATGQARIAELTLRRADAVAVVAEADRSLASAADAEKGARAALDAQQQRFGDRARIAGLIEREIRYREDRRQEKEIEHALDAMTARAAALEANQQALGPREAAARQRLETASGRRAACEAALEAARPRLAQAKTAAGRLAEARRAAARARSAVEAAGAEAERTRAALQAMEAARRAADEVVRAATDELHRVEREHAAHALRASLAVGEPCPVCLTEVRRVPAVETVDHLEQGRVALEDAEAHLGRAQTDERRAGDAAAAAAEALRVSARTDAECRAEADRLARELRGVLPEDLRDETRWPEVFQARIDAMVADRAAAGEEVEAAQGALAALAADLAKIAGELGPLPARIEEQRRALLAIRGRGEDTERELAALLGRPAGPDAAGELASIDAGLRQAAEVLASAAADCQRARERLREMQAAAAGAERDLDAEAARARARGDERTLLAGERNDIQSVLERVVPGRAEVAEAISTEIATLVAARARQEEIRRELDGARQARERADRHVALVVARIGEIERQLEERRTLGLAARDALEEARAELTARLATAGLALSGDGDEPGELAVVVHRARKERDTAVERSAALGAEDRGLAEKVARADACREQRDAARARAEVARELGLLLGANQLQTHVLLDAMRVLVEDGSVHLQRLSDGRYRLRAEDLDFQVVDAWNGDAVRSVKTLSGGETFLTSLALALALAERLADLAAGAHGHEALESLFVDEGFGALDAEETLETVVQAIEALPTHDRLVGIVTHLTALAERMPVQVTVRKAPEGSRVEMRR
jgi:exonuclease SbcC